MRQWENQPYTVDGVWGTLVRLCSQRWHAYGNKIAHEASHWSWVALYTGQVVLGCLSSCRSFQSKVRCFSLSKLSPKPYWRRSSIGLPLNKKELLDSDGLSSGDDGSDISLGNDGGPDMSGSEDESNTNYGDGEVLDDDDDDQVVFLGGAHGGRGACGRGGRGVYQGRGGWGRGEGRGIGTEVGRGRGWGRGNSRSQRRGRGTPATVATQMWAATMVSLHHSPGTMRILGHLDNENLLHWESLMATSLKTFSRWENCACSNSSFRRNCRSNCTAHKWVCLAAHWTKARICEWNWRINQ